MVIIDWNKQYVYYSAKKNKIYILLVDDLIFRAFKFDRLYDDLVSIGEL